MRRFADIYEFPLPVGKDHIECFYYPYLSQKYLLLYDTSCIHQILGRHVQATISVQTETIHRVVVSSVRGFPSTVESMAIVV